MLELSTVVKRTAQQVSCNLNEDVAILDLKNAVYFGLEGVGAYIWETLEQPKSVAELCRSVVGAFDVPQERCHADVLAFLGYMKEAGLVETVS